MSSKNENARHSVDQREEVSWISTKGERRLLFVKKAPLAKTGGSLGVGDEKLND